MPDAMNFRRARLPIALWAAGLAALAVLAMSSATPQLAHAASACKTWGKMSPKRLAAPQARKAVLCLINKKRQRAGVGKLHRRKELQKAAQRHNERMHGTDCFSHQCPGEPSLDRRVKNAGYLRGGVGRWGFGENIAWGMRGKGTPKAMVKAWMNSPGHRANILRSDFEHLGVGFNNGSPHAKRAAGGIYTTVFGLRQG
jgi:uncharacterized protein YkwD